MAPQAELARAAGIRRAHPLYSSVTLSLLTEIINSRLFTTVRPDANTFVLVGMLSIRAASIFWEYQRVWKMEKCCQYKVLKQINDRHSFAPQCRCETRSG
jgi:hypothetical protein